jgi:hypothetical protein
MSENYLLLEIRERLMNISLSTVFGQSIVQGVQVSINDTIEMILSQAQDNRQLVSDIVGEETLQLIESI